MRAVDRYQAAIRDFRWSIPPDYAIASDICGKWAVAEPGRVAIVEAGLDSAPVEVTHGALDALSGRLAAALARRGLGRGDRIGIMLPQSAAVVVAHLAALKLGALALPLAALFGPDALDYRLRHSDARALITDAAGLAKLRRIEPALPGLEIAVCLEGADAGALGWEALLTEKGEPAPRLATGPDDPAMIIYTSGTTGQPKGAVHGQRVLAGHMPGFGFAHADLVHADLVHADLVHAHLPAPGARMWTPADWAWAGGLLNALMPSLALGVPVVAWPHDKFVPEEALAIVAAHGVTHAFLPPTALRLLKAAHRDGERYRLPLTSIMSAGETLGPDTFAWAEAAFGFPVDELYGQTECNLVLGSSSALGVSRPGHIGKPVPGHHVALIDEDGRFVPPGEPGEIAVARPDPVMFLRYWNDDAATQAKFRGAFMVTGDRAVADADGSIRFLGRDDDIITSSGYRIGPGEIEDCLARHPAVAFAAVIGKPDPVRTEIVKAFVVLAPGAAPSAGLTAELQAFVRARLSAHEYPRDIAYVASLPLTATGKIVRRALRETEAGRLAAE